MIPKLPNRSFTLHLIRHGESTANAGGDLVGGVDAALTERGRLQAKHLGAFFAPGRDWLGPVVFCSTYARAMDTAEIACTEAKYDLRTIQYDARLVEIGRGEFDNRPMAEVLTEVERRKMSLFGMDYRTPGGESMHEVGARMLDWVIETCFDKGPEEGHVVYSVFTHGHATRCLLQKVLGFDPYLTWRLRIDNTSITTLSHGVHGWSLDRVNATPHLDRL